MDQKQNQGRNELPEVLEHLIEGFQIIDRDWRYTYVNAAAAAHGRSTKDALVGKTMMECFPGIEKTELFRKLERCLRENTTDALTNSFAYPDGTTRHFELRIEPVPNGLCVLSIDVSEKIEAERKLRALEEERNQADRLETVGRLAAGIAHDFSNLLGVILAHAEAALTRQSGPSREDAVGIMDAARSSADLTRQLLAYGRRQVIRREVVDPVDLVNKLCVLLDRTLGGRVHVKVVKRGTVGKVEVDPSQFDQVVMNLVLNARDAMPNGGAITITIEEVESRIRILVSDTGTGMDEVTRSHIFEPFFTTKERSKGTGLGLSTVYGIIKQHAGNIEVKSVVGEGSTFEVDFPVATSVPRVSDPPLSAPRPKAPTDQTILVAEDSPSLSKLISTTLRAAGYNVITAATGVEALDVCKGSNHIDLLVTDVVMPGMRGPALIAATKQLRPDLRFLCTSGYATEDVKSEADLPEGVEFLEKPYLPSVFLRTVRSLLARAP